MRASPRLASFRRGYGLGKCLMFVLLSKASLLLYLFCSSFITLSITFVCFTFLYQWIIVSLSVDFFISSGFTLNGFFLSQVFYNNGFFSYIGVSHFNSPFICFSHTVSLSWRPLSLWSLSSSSLSFGGAVKPTQRATNVSTITTLLSAPPMFRSKRGSEKERKKEKKNIVRWE